LWLIFPSGLTVQEPLVSDTGNVIPEAIDAVIPVQMQPAPASVVASPNQVLLGAIDGVLKEEEERNPRDAPRASREGVVAQRLVCPFTIAKRKLIPQYAHRDQPLRTGVGAVSLQDL
jgi:hypothetical protein